MILMNNSNTSILFSSNNFLDYYIQMCKVSLSNKISNNDLSVAQLLSLYDLKDVMNALDTIKTDSNNNIYVDDQSNESIILRYLEYGGEGVKSPHLFSEINNKFKLY